MEKTRCSVCCTGVQACAWKRQMSPMTTSHTPLEGPSSWTLSASSSGRSSGIALQSPVTMRYKGIQTPSAKLDQTLRVRETGFARRCAGAFAAQRPLSGRKSFAICHAFWQKPVFAQEHTSRPGQGPSTQASNRERSCARALSPRIRYVCRSLQRLGSAVEERHTALLYENSQGVVETALPALQHRGYLERLEKRSAALDADHSRTVSGTLYKVFCNCGIFRTSSSLRKRKEAICWRAPFPEGRVAAKEAGSTKAAEGSHAQTTAEEACS